MCACVCTCRVQRLTSDVFLYHVPLWSLAELRASCLCEAGRPVTPKIFVFLYPMTVVTVHTTMPGSYIVASIQIQVLMLVQVLNLLSKHLLKNSWACVMT